MIAMKQPTKKTAQRKPGRPSTYTSKSGAEVCRRLATGEPLAQICRRSHLPTKRTVSNWVNAKPDFAREFREAREEGFDALAWECLTIADDTSRDTIETEHGPRPDNEWIARSKVRIETRLKLLAKWDPRRYGDKLDLEVKGDAVVRVVIGGDA